jgi:hypothetical protein
MRKKMSVLLAAVMVLLITASPAMAAPRLLPTLGCTRPMSRYQGVCRDMSMFLSRRHRRTRFARVDTYSSVRKVEPRVARHVRRDPVPLQQLRGTRGLRDPPHPHPGAALLVPQLEQGTGGLPQRHVGGDAVPAGVSRDHFRGAALGYLPPGRLEGLLISSRVMLRTPISAGDDGGDEAADEPDVGPGERPALGIRSQSS